MIEQRLDIKGNVHSTRVNDDSVDDFTEKAERKGNLTLDGLLVYEAQQFSGHLHTSLNVKSSGTPAEELGGTYSRILRNMHIEEDDLLLLLRSICTLTDAWNTVASAKPTSLRQRLWGDYSAFSSVIVDPNVLGASLFEYCNSKGDEFDVLFYVTTDPTQPSVKYDTLHMQSRYVSSTA